MTRQEYLMDRYEDALFSLMMDKVATQEGEKALLELERLQKEASINVPETLHRKCLKTISRYFARKRAKAARHTVSNVISKIAVVALVGILTFTIAFATSPTFRANTMNFVMEMFDDHVEFRFEESESATISDLNITTNWLPKGYDIVNEIGDSNIKTVILEKSQEEQIIISLCSVGYNVGLDSENAVLTEIFVNDTPAHLIQNNDEHAVQVVWEIESLSAFVQVFGRNIDPAILIKIADNIAIE